MTAGNKMAPGILGKKLGMTQFFLPDGRVVPATALQAGPCVVVQRKTTEKDGYEAVQLGLVEFVKPARVNKPATGHFKKAGVEPGPLLRELRIRRGRGEDLKSGDRVLAGEFQIGEKVDVVGRSKGRGFAGVVKRHHFRGGPDTHGSMSHRAPGSIGASSYPSRVIRGTRMGGHMGNARVTARNLEIVEVHAEDHVILVRGAVPGPNGSYVVLRRTE
jgi:large subunit ribosomal protein L3